MMPANELAAVIVKALDAKKGENIQLLKTRELTTLADYFVICTASSSTHVKTRPWSIITTTATSRPR